MKKALKFLIAPAMMVLAVIGFTTVETDARAQLGGIEDTWKPDLGDCAGSPTDCLDTIVIIIKR